MPAENQESERKRSRPVTKPKKMDALKRNKSLVGIVIIIAIVVVIAGLFVFIPKNGNNNSSTSNPIAVISTSLGTMRVELYQDKMPITTANFIKLANAGFYNNTIFHRIGSGFMIQAGGYSIDGTQITSPYGNIQFESSDVKHVNGTISMASTGTKVGGAAQFFICDGAQSFLDGNYAAFGVVTPDTLSVVHTIASQAHDNSFNDGTGAPNTPIEIYSITIENQ